MLRRVATERVKITTIYWILVGVGFLVFIVTSVRNSSAFVDVCAAFAAFLLMRWPVLFGSASFIDGQQMLAQSITARHFPIPWLSFDGTTSGPLNTYGLILPSLFGIPASELDARIMATILACVLVISCYVTVCAIYGRRLACATAGVVSIVFGFASSIDTTTYATELPTMVLDAMAIAALAVTVTRTKSISWIIVLGGLCCGAMPFAKLQGTLLSVATAMLFAIVIITRTASWKDRIRSLTIFGSAVCMPAIILLVPVAVSGAFSDFYISYIRQAIFSMTGGSAKLVTAFKDVPELAALFRPALLMTLALIVLAGCEFVAAGRFKEQRPFQLSLRRHGYPAAAAMLICVAFYSVQAPHRDYAHYFLLLLMPVILLVATLAGAVQCSTQTWVQRAGAALVISYSVSVCFYSIGVSNPNRTAFFKDSFGKSTVSDDPVANEIAAQRGPSGRVAIWGYSPQLYIHSGSIMGTRDSISQFAISEGAYREYYRQRFLRDMIANRPALFVDTTGPSDFAFHDRAGQGYETFAALANFIASNYRFLNESQNMRIFKRLSRS